MRRLLPVLLLAGCAPASTIAPVAGLPSPPDGGAPPVVRGREELRAAQAEAGTSFRVDVMTADQAPEVAVPAAPESFAIAPSAGRTRVVGRDAVGAMYGAYELAERLRLDGAGALPLSAPVVGSPAVPVRAANLFVILPDKREAAWWFLDEGFWDEYLDLLVRARIDVLDLHAMYSLENTQFPNALLYFATSASFPAVGAPAADRERNVAALARVVELAKDRGMKVGFMTYRADTSLSGAGGDLLTDDASLRTYTREAAEDLARKVPGLSMIGFRIGETGHSAEWYAKTFVAGVKASGTAATIYTRTWLSNKPEILALAAAVAPTPFLIEAKYNGEQLGPPSIIAGGAFVDQGWSHYSYEDYLQAPSPWDLLFQVRTYGTHRIFRQASVGAARRIAATFTFGGARGYTLEAPHAYLPQRDFLHEGADRYSPWSFRRDELMYLLYGRLGYDPSTPERAFRAALARRVGGDTLWAPLQAASEIVPWIQLAHTRGPDHRDFAPELEWGGAVGYWASAPGAPAPPDACCTKPYHGPFDSFAIASPVDAAADLLAGRPTTRLSPAVVAGRILDAAARARALPAKIPDGAEARDVARECAALADLGDYFGHKLRAAEALAVYAGSGRGDWLDEARREIGLADDGWRALAADTAYVQPFDENLRMSVLGLSPYHWRLSLPLLDRDAASIDAVEAAVKKAPPTWSGTLPDPSAVLSAPRGSGPGLAGLAIAPPDPAAASWTVTATFARPLAAGAIVRVWWKPFSSAAQWRSVDAGGAGDTFTATITPPAGTAGALYAVEEIEGAEGFRYPDPLAGPPYLALPPRR